MVPRKQREMGCHPLLLVGYRQCVGYPLAQLQVRSTGEFSSEIWKRLPSSAVVLLSCSLQSLIIQDLWPATAGFNVKGKMTRPELLEPMPDSAFTHSIISQRVVVFSKLRRLQRTPNELLRHRHISSALLELLLMCVCNTPALDESKTLHLQRFL